MSSLTVGDLLDFIEEYKIPREGKIYCQRIEDFYFEKYNWKTIKKDSEFTYSSKELNKLIESGEYKNEDNFPDWSEEFAKSQYVSEEDIEKCKSQFYKIFTYVGYDNEDLYLTGHG